MAKRVTADPEGRFSAEIMEFDDDDGVEERPSKAAPPASAVDLSDTQVGEGVDWASPTTGKKYHFTIPPGPLVLQQDFCKFSPSTGEFVINHTSEKFQRFAIPNYVKSLDGSAIDRHSMKTGELMELMTSFMLHLL
jgi:hypothetical protein